VFFLIMYLIPFWDLIPTLVMHKYYCSAQAGFWVYKTPEEWAEENPGILETLTAYEKPINANLSIGLVSQRNDQFGRLFDITEIGELSIKKQRTLVVDVKSGKILAENIDFSRGFGQLALGHD